MMLIKFHEMLEQVWHMIQTKSDMVEDKNMVKSKDIKVVKW